MIREPSYDEETAVLGFFEGMAQGLAAAMVGDMSLAVATQGPGPNAEAAASGPGPTMPDAADPGVAEREAPGGAGLDVLLCSQGLMDLPEELREGEGGLCIGHLEDGVFRLALQGAVEVSRHTEMQAVRVKEKAARLFLYGRDVLGDSVLRHDRDLRTGDHCIVLDPRGAALGIGAVVGRFKGARPAVRSVHDLGAYLRDQGS